MDGLLLLIGQLASVARRHRRALAVWVSGCTLVSVAVVLLLPPTYRATTLLIPNANQGSMAAGLDGLSTVAGQLGINVAGAGNDPARVFPDILRSRTLVRRVLQSKVAPRAGGAQVYLDRFGRRSAPEAERLEAATKTFIERRSANVLDPKNSSIKIVIYDRDPEVAAAVANAMSRELDRINLEINRSNARARRAFVEARLAEVRAELAADEESLKDFREQNRAIAASPQLLLESERLARKVRVDEEVYLTLTREHELAKIDEVRDVPVINVLDEATPPAFPHAPHRPLVVSVVFVLSLLAGLVGAMLWDDRRRLAADLGAAAGDHAP
jgi:uncharacterized protein involved in exopolysaccharide biosynthesis